MRGLQKLRNGCRYLLESVRELLGIQSDQASSHVRRDVSSQLEAAVVLEKNRKIFPFGKIEILLLPPTKSIARDFEAAFMTNSLLKTDVIRILKGADVQYPPDLEISVELRPARVSGDRNAEFSSLYAMKFREPVDTKRYKVPDVVLEIVKGSAEQSVYRLAKDRLLIGCQPRVRDREGRLVRINNVVFPDTGNEVNATVSDMHARIWFDFTRQEFRIMDETSLYGTRIVREGHTIEVPAENPRGVGLRSGDEICFGQASVRFRTIKNRD